MVSTALARPETSERCRTATARFLDVRSTRSSCVTRPISTMATTMQRRALSTTISRTRLLNAARGVLDDKNDTGRVLRCFPLKRQHIQPSPRTPLDFHQTLCRLLGQAQRRVTLASLYIGPAADIVYEKEVELLEALRDAAKKKNGDGGNNIDIKILLDHHRALRPVPVKSNNAKTTITSAHACYDAVGNHGTVHLLSVLPPLLQRVLPNPYNEVAGVFHMKAYIVDDHILLSGANLSEEYFVDRIDRYLWLTCPELVQFYQDLVDALCEHGVQYKGDRQRLLPPKTTRKQLLASLQNILTTTNPAKYDVDGSHDDPDDPVAYAVPTFHVPPSYVRNMRMFRNDHQVLQSLFREATSSSKNDGITTTRQLDCRIATAYLNPTDALLHLLAPLQRVYFLTAGRVSHGFKPKPKAGNQGRDWIPTVFEYSAQLAAQKSNNVVVTYYQRPGWSFHAKGIWLTSSSESVSDDTVVDTTVADAVLNARLPTDARVYAVTHGSSNYGQRSAYRDMECNLLLILPEASPLAKEHVDEWNALCDYAVSATEEGTRPILPQIRGAFPVIRYFF